MATPNMVVVQLLVSFLFRLSTAVFSQSTITTLPGFPGPLPFKLETGYIGVGENEEVQLFYYFIESEGDPLKDPLLLWLNGGPGCSAFSGLIYEIGSIHFDLAAFDGSFPSLITNPYSWTKVASIIFLDAPVGTGFSYSTTPQGYFTSDTKAAQYNYMFLRKWLSSHPKFMKNWIYVAGDSYGGKIVPMVALAIAKGNEAGLEPQMLLQGYIVGNPVTDIDEDENEKIPYAHRMGLISDEYFEFAKSSCNGKYVNPDPDNIQCIHALGLVNECTKLLNTAHILERKCKFMPPKPNGSRPRYSFIEDDPTDLISLPQYMEPSREIISSFSKPNLSHDEYPSVQLKAQRRDVEDDLTDLISRDLISLPLDMEPCLDFHHLSSYIWMNNETVQEALHIRKGSIHEWKRCNKSLPYDRDVESAVEYHRILNEKGFQALAYSGDYDLDVPYMSTLKWIRKLNLTLDDGWRPWTIDGQVAGYTQKYKNNQAFLTFATVRGAGHTAPEYKPKECFQMIKRWLSLYSL